jgi:hypothetical protein
VAFSCTRRGCARRFRRANLVRALGVDRTGNVKKAEDIDWAVTRARAFRLLPREYDELRAAARYLRWKQGDSIAFAPALHVGARKGKRVGQGEQSETRAKLAE